MSEDGPAPDSAGAVQRFWHTPFCNNRYGVAHPVNHEHANLPSFS